MTNSYSEAYRQDLKENAKRWNNPRPQFVDEFDPDHPRQQNMDFPDNLRFWEMGINARHNTSLDYRQMDDRHFRELCYQSGNGRNYALYMRGKIDFHGPQHLRPEWIAEKLGVPFNLAVRAARIFRRINLNRKSVKALIYGYVRSDGVRTKGLRSLPHNKIDQLLDSLAETVKGMDEVTVQRENFIPGPYDSFQEDSNDCDETEDELSEQPAASGDNNPYSAFPLFYGEDSLSHEFVVMIKTADLETIEKLQKAWHKRKYWYWSQAQNSHFWACVKARKAAIRIQAKKNMSESGKLALHWIHSFRDRPIIRAIAFAYSKGQSFELSGYTIEFKGIPNKAEVRLIWEKVNKYQPKSKAA